MKINPLLLKVTCKVRKMWWREESRNTSDPAGVHDLPETYGLYRRGKTTPVLRPLQTSAEKNEQDKKNVVKG